MTGLACRRASSTARFCTSGTSSSGSSTPRSPRATMMPSNASTISSRFSTACGFSILAMTGQADALLVHDLVHVARCRRPSARTTARSGRRRGAAPSAGRPRPSRTAPARTTATPGRLMPLLLRTGPATIDPGDARRCRRPRRPRSAHLAVVDQDGSPGATSPGRPLYVVEQIARVARRRRSVVIVNVVAVVERRPGRRRTVPSRIFGPCRSARMPTPCPRRVGGLADQLVDLLVVGVDAVAEVQPGDVHARRRRARGSARECSTSPARGCRRSLLDARIEPSGLPVSHREPSLDRSKCGRPDRLGRGSDDQRTLGRRDRRRQRRSTR